MKLILLFALLVTYAKARGIGSADNTILGNAIIELASRCGNQFVIEESKVRGKECNVIVPPYQEKQLKCLMFYDINTQVCREKPVIPASDYAAKMNEKQNITSFCESAKYWKIQNIPEYPDYKPELEMIFNDFLNCIKVCSVEEDLLSKDVNFYCKYYKWGLDLLNSKDPIKNGQTNITETSGAASAKTNIVSAVDKTYSTPNAAETNKTTQPQDSAAKDIEVNVKPSVPEPSVKTAPSTSKVEKVDESAKDVPAEVPAAEQNKETAVQIEPMPSSDDNVPKIQNNEEKPPNKVDEEEELKDSVLNKPKLPNSDPDYESEIDEEDGKEGLPDLNGDDDDGVLGEIKPVASHEKQPKVAEVAVSVLNPEDSEKSIFPNMQDGFAGDDDDHFFPFFLTVVVMVVLLYVLYHNKSKVTKVVLGLIVEGRQPGRRRGSRGHAYRRLDTLEQAMSTSSAAPPSKIIY